MTYQELLTGVAVLKSTDLFPGTISTKMKAEEYNSVMNNIATAFNILYLKLRTLNDLHDHVKATVEKGIENSQKELNENLKIIENLSDSYSNMEYVSENIDFKENISKITDRQGKVIYPMKINDGTLIVASHEINKANIESVKMTANYVPYTSSYDNLKENNTSSSVYHIDAPDKIIEHYIVTFTNPTEMNYINISTINSKVSNLSIYDENDIEYEINNLYYINTVLAKKIEFDITCKNFEGERKGNTAVAIKDLSIESNPSLSQISTLKNSADFLNDLEKIANVGLYRGNYTQWKNVSDDILNRNNAVDNTSSMTYYDKNGVKYGEESVISSSGAIIQTLSTTGYRYIPTNEVTMELVSENGKYDIPDKPSSNVTYEVNMKNSYEYIFGINKLETSFNYVEEISGYISPAINVDTINYIKLSVDTDSFESTEFYIIDGVNEYPILPVEQEKVEKEKLIQNINTRFVIDTSKEYTIFKDNEKENISLEEVYNRDLSSADYRISYYPSSGHSYSSNSDSIAIKIIQYKTIVPSEIRSISIQKYGGVLNWTI